MSAILKVLAVCAFFGLPAETSCDSSYYEKFYAARRFVPPKLNALLQYNFTVTVDRAEIVVSPDEHIALTGSIKELGEWSPNDAVLLNRTDKHNVWYGEVMLPQNKYIDYKFFVAATDQRQPRQLLVRYWEPHVHARNFNTTKLPGNRTDSFGSIGSESLVRRGWLDSGHIVQFKVFHTPEFFDAAPVEDELYIHLQPVDPESRVPIVQSARANVEYVLMNYGNSILRTQPQFGVPYKIHDILMFQATVTQIEKVAFLVRVYGRQAKSELIRQLSYQYILPTSLVASEGHLTVDLMSPVLLTIIGQLRLEYLVVNPLANSSFNLRSSFVSYWRPAWLGLDIGHRGLGKSLSNAKSIAPVTENTLASMKAAGILGAEMVEFDVHLTSDLVPVIYHDYAIRVCIDSKTPTSPKDLTQVLIKDVTYEQLKNLKTYQVIGTSKIIEYPAHNNVDDVDQRLFPSLADLLLQVNRTLGFDIELKWPQLKTNDTYESTQTIDKNLFVDRVLDVLQLYGCGRLTILKSFDADICTLLRYKQNMYPVLFLTSSTEQAYADPRTHNIINSINFGQASDLAGIVPNAALIKRNPDLVKLSKAVLPLILVWGADIKDRDTIDWLKAQQVNGVIYDRMDLLLPPDDLNVLQSQHDLPAFFELQCTAAATANRASMNSTIDSVLSNINLV